MNGIFSDPVATSTILSALIGALLAFMLVLVRDWLGKIFDRKYKHYDALVKIEAQTQAQGGTIHDNILILPHFSKTLRDGNLYWTNLAQIPYNPDIIYELHNIDLINDIYQYHYSLRRANDDMKNIISGYKTMEKAFIAKQIEPEDYKANAANIADNLDIICEYLDKDVMPQLLRLISKVRILLKKDKTIGMRIRSKLIGHTKVSEKEISAELKIVKKEIKAGEKLHQEKMNKRSTKSRSVN